MDQRLARTSVSGEGAGRARRRHIPTSLAVPGPRPLWVPCNTEVQIILARFSSREAWRLNASLIAVWRHFLQPSASTEYRGFPCSFWGMSRMYPAPSLSLFVAKKSRLSPSHALNSSDNAGGTLLDDRLLHVKLRATVARIRASSLSRTSTLKRVIRGTKYLSLQRYISD